MWQDLREEVADMFDTLAGCLDGRDGLSWRKNVEASPERRAYKAAKEREYAAKRKGAVCVSFTVREPLCKRARLGRPSLASIERCDTLSGQ